MWSDKHDLIFVSLENWDDVWRRNQFVCRELATRHREMQILFVGRARDVSGSVRRCDGSDIRCAATWQPTELRNITVARPLKLMPNTFSLGRQINQWMARAQIKRMVQRLALRSPILWLNPHDAVHMVGRLDEACVIYDITDDWAQCARQKRLRRRIIEEDQQLCRRADTVIVCSENLFQSRQSLAKQIHLVPNGVDVEHYRPAHIGTASPPEETRYWSKPVMGYTGTLHTDRLDIDLLEAVAKSLPEATAVLIGPDHLSKSARSRLDALRNVTIRHPVAYERLPQFMRRFDVCIVPHRITAFTDSLNPIKLWEYLAAGKPIVSTNVAGFRDYPQHVRIASDPASFVGAIKHALREDDTCAPARRAEASRHSWSDRVDAIERIITRCVRSHVSNYSN